MVIMNQKIVSLLFLFIVLLLNSPASIFSQEYTLDSVRFKAQAHFPDFPNALQTSDFELQEFDFKSFATISTTGTGSSSSQGGYSLLSATLGITDDVELLDLGSARSFIQARELLQPYVYPSPFRLSEGAELGYELSDDMDIELRIYNMAGNEIHRDFFPAGLQGGLGHHGHRDYNKVPIELSTFDDEELSAGVYFFVLVNSGKVVAKGKFAIRP